MGRYEVRCELGRGSMGIVHRAHDPVMGRDVALKTILLPNGLPDDKRDEFHQRFLREAQAAGRLSHPGIVTVYDFNKDGDDDLPYIAMEFVQGSTLHELITHEGPLRPEWVVSIGDTLADALQAAYDAGIVHRDIKPANILVRETDGVAKITDFGIARVSYTELTHAGTTYGSPAYMAPERIEGKPADLRSDLFSLAVILYESLCGQRPFGGDDFASICYWIINEPPASICSREPGLTPAFDAFFDSALAKHPDQRFQTGAAFREALELVRQQQVLFTNGAATMLMPTGTGRAVFGVEPVGSEGEVTRTSALVAESSVLPQRPQVPLPIAGQRSFRLWLGVGTAGLVLVLLVLLAMRGGEQRAALEPDVARHPAHEVAALSDEPTRESDGAGDRQPAAERQPAVNTTERSVAVSSQKPANRPATLATPPALDRAPKNAPVASAAPAERAPEPARRELVPAATTPAETVASGEVGAPAPAVPAAPQEPAVLQLSIKSSVKSGRLVLLAGDQEIYTVSLDTEDRALSRAYQKVIRKVQQELAAEVSVPADTRSLTVRVYSEAKSRWYEDHLDVDLSPGSSQPVEVVAGRTFGRWLSISTE